MAVDIFLELEGIDGESVDSVYADKIQVISVKWSGSQSGTMHEGLGGGSGKSSFQDIVIEKYVDKSTPALLKHLSTGTHVPTGKLVFRKAGGEEPIEYLAIELTSILISSFELGASVDSERDRLTEVVTLNFAEFKEIYTPQDDAGSAGAAVEFGYNIASNVVV